MPRAVLDSSVLVSALITPHGAPGQVLDAAERGAFTLCLSSELLAETAGVLLRDPKLQARYGIDPSSVEAYCDGLAAVAQMATDLPKLQAVPGDPKDDMVVATAVASAAEFLVTGDRKHLLSLGNYEGIRMFTPRKFLDFLGNQA